MMEKVTSREQAEAARVEAVALATWCRFRAEIEAQFPQIAFTWAPFPAFLWAKKPGWAEAEAEADFQLRTTDFEAWCRKTARKPFTADTPLKDDEVRAEIREAEATLAELPKPPEKRGYEFL